MPLISKSTFYKTPAGENNKFNLELQKVSNDPARPLRKNEKNRAINKTDETECSRL